MNTDESTQLLKYLLQQDADYVLEWLTAASRGQQPVPKDFPWLALAEAAAFNASEALDLRWAEVAVNVYDQLASYADVLSAMNLRAYLISRMGPVPHHPVLGVEQVINWFWASLEKPYEEAELLANAWQEVAKEGVHDWSSEWHTRVPIDDNWVELSARDLQQLRRIKNRLKVIQVLVESGHVVPDKPLGNWLSLADQLP